MSSLAHAKNESGRLKIRNIANVNTRQMKTRSQRNFCYKNTLLYKKTRRPATTRNDKKSAILKDTIKNVFKLLLWSAHINYICVYFIWHYWRRCKTTHQWSYFLAHVDYHRVDIALFQSAQVDFFKTKQNTSNSPVQFCPFPVYPSWQ